MISVSKLALASAILGGTALVTAVGSVGDVLLSEFGPWLDSIYGTGPTAARDWAGRVLTLSFLVGVVGMILGAAALDIKEIGRSQRLLARMGIGSGMLMLLVFLVGFGFFSN